MILECTLKSTDFVPIVKKPRLWIAPHTLGFGSQLTLDDEIGHQILAAYPGAFKVLQYGDAPKAETKTRKKDYEKKVTGSDELMTKEISDTVSHVSL